MTPSLLSGRVVTEKAAWIRRMLSGLRALPLSSYESFHSDARNIASGESYLRRALEALLDLGRHILARGFGQAAIEYKEVAKGLIETNVLGEKEGNLLRQLAGYRNRLVHFYNEISERELYEICSTRVGDIELLLTAVLKWIEIHPEMIDRGL